MTKLIACFYKDEDYYFAYHYIPGYDLYNILNMGSFFLLDSTVRFEKYSKLMDLVDYMNVNGDVAPDDIKLLRIPQNEDEYFIMPLMNLKKLPFKLDKKISPEFIKVGEQFEVSDFVYQVF